MKPVEKKQTARIHAAVNGHWTAFLMLAGACIAVYYNSVGGGFVFDDIQLVQTEDRIQKLSNIPRMLNPWDPSFRTYRPLRTISYAIDYHFTRDDPSGYHIANILYHVLCTWLVFLISRQLLAAWAPALLAAALFAVHPIHTEAVSYISGRRDVLSTLFFLLGFYWFIKLRKSHKSGFLVGIFAAYALGLLSKEMAVTLPAIMLLYDWFAELHGRRSARGLSSWLELPGSLKAVLRKHRRLYLAILAVGLLLTCYYLFVTPPTRMRAYWGGSAYINFLTTAKIFAKYLQLVFFPITLVADYNSGQVFTIALTILDPVVLLALLVVALGLFASFWFLRVDPVIGFAGLFFFITLLPVAHIIPHHELISEHHLYLPSVGICLVLARATEKLQKKRSVGKWAYGAAAIVLALFSSRTVVRNRDWKSEYTLWTATLRAAPLSMRAHTNLGLVHLSRSLENQNELDVAIEHLEKSLAIRSKPELGTISRRRALQNLGGAYLKKRQYDRSLQCFEECLKLDPKNYTSYINIGVVYNNRNQHLQAIEAYKKALLISPSSKEAMLHLATGYATVRDYKAALETYNRLIESDRGTKYTASAHFMMGSIYYHHLQEHEQGTHHFEIARKMDPVRYPAETWLGKPIETQKVESPTDESHLR